MSTGAETLVVTAGAAAGRTIAVDGEVVLGREAEGAGLIEGDADLSRRHARVARDEHGALVVEDLGSTNGTWVNGVRIDAPRPLVPGDVLRVGLSELEVVGEPEPEPEPEPAKAEEQKQESEQEEQEPDAPTMAPAPPVEQVGAPAPPPGPGAPAAPLVGLAPPAALLHEGKRVGVSPAGIRIGRTGDNDVALDDELVSRRHAQIAAADGRYYLSDLGSTNGTTLNGERLVAESRWLNAGDTIGIGAATLRFLTGQETRVGDLKTIGLTPAAPRTVRLEGDRLTFGRDAANDVVLDNPSISRFHAEVVRAGDRLEVRDLGSRNGTRLNGHLVTASPVATGDEVGIGPFRFVWDGDEFVGRDDGGALRLEGVEVGMKIKDKVILDRASLTVLPGEFVVVIGESGSGKSTMVKALAGVMSPTSGVVTVNGDPVRSRMPEIGYVPQFEITHGRLTVLESLRYSARLRLPQDATREDVEQAVARVVEEVALGEHQHQRIDSLSGGQRKRVGVATELVSRPGLLFLDEPTTGLDPGLETQMMKLFRQLAEVGARAVICVTHATKNLGLADRVLVMGRGGQPCFVGAPADAKEFFGVEDFDGIYDRLIERPAVEWRADFERTHAKPPQQAAAAPAAAPAEARTPRRSHRTEPLPQAKVLAARYSRTFVRDRKNLLILLLQVPVLAIFAALLFKDAFGPGKQSETGTFLFMLVTMAVWFGALDSIREVIKERPIVEREAQIGVRTLAYIGSKVAVLFSVVALQVLILVVIALSIRSPGMRGDVTQLVITFLITGFVAVAMGLLISSLVRTQEQATAILPLAMILQLLFAGALVTTKSMGGLGIVSTLVFSRWSFAGAGHVGGMKFYIDNQKIGVTEFSKDFFALPAPAVWAILLLFLGAFLGAMFLLLRRLEPRVD